MFGDDADNNGIFTWKQSSLDIRVFSDDVREDWISKCYKVTYLSTTLCVYSSHHTLESSINLSEGGDEKYFLEELSTTTVGSFEVTGEPTNRRKRLPTTLGKQT